MKVNVPYINLPMQWKAEREFLLPIIEDVMSSGDFIGGARVEGFEHSVSALCETDFCVALNSGTDALVTGLVAMGIGRGDEVITPPNSFVASTAAISHIGAVPVFVDVVSDQSIDASKIEAAITKKTKAIMPVHLTGRMAQMDTIMEIADHFKIGVIEDSAQSIGSKFNTKSSGSIGQVGCFSTHPLKNLNACGDGGFLITNNRDIADRVRSLRNHGLLDRNTVKEFGYVSRMDALQASILTYRLNKLESVTSKRQHNASLYDELLDREYCFTPEPDSKIFNTYHTYVIQVSNRDGLQRYLTERAIGTAIHYPIPIHLQPAAKNLGYKLGDFPVTESQAGKILSLPIHQFLKDSDIEAVASTVNKFFREAE